MTRQENEALFRLLEEKERRNKLCPIANLIWNPNGQALAAKLVEETDILLFCAGNRSGKTHFVVAEVVASLLGYRPWMVPGFKMVKDTSGNPKFPERDEMPTGSWVKRSDGLPIQHPATVLFVTGLPLSKGLKVLEKKWHELIPKGVKFDRYSGQWGVMAKATLQESELICAADTQSVQSFEGADYDVAFFDEPVRRNVYTAIKRGLVDRRGRIVWSMTPLNDARSAWVARDIVLSEDCRDDVKVVYGSASDNKHVDQVALAAFLNDPSMPEDERRARKTGEFGSMGNKIVSTFDEATAVIPPTDLPPNIPRILCADPHHSKPTCLIWVALLSDEHWIIYREWPTVPIHTQGVPRMSISDLAANIKTAEGKENIVYRVCDPQFGRQHGMNLGVRFKSFQEEMAEYSLYFDTHVDNCIERGIGALRDVFKESPETKHPKIQIFNNLKNTINSLGLWSYEDTPRGDRKVSEKMKDFCDCVRYTVMYNPSANTDDVGGHSYLEEDDE